MRTIGIIGAMEEEISFLREKMDIVTTKSVVGLTYYVGRYEGNNVVLVKSGIGKVNAAVCTQAMIDPTPDTCSNQVKTTPYSFLLPESGGQK